MGGAESFSARTEGVGRMVAENHGNYRVQQACGSPEHIKTSTTQQVEVGNDYVGFKLREFLRGCGGFGGSDNLMRSLPVDRVLNQCAKPRIVLEQEYPHYLMLLQGIDFGNQPRQKEAVGVCPTRRSALLYDAVLDGVQGEVGIGLEVHLFKDAGAIGADGFDAEIMLGGDGGDGLAGTDHFEDKELAIGESFMRFPAAGFDRHGEQLGEVRREVFPASVNVADSVDKDAGGAFLVDVAGGTGTNCADADLLFGELRKDQDRKLRVLAFEFMK